MLIRLEKCHGFGGVNKDCGKCTYCLINECVSEAEIEHRCGRDGLIFYWNAVRSQNEEG